MKTIINGLKDENPVFALGLGLCPALAVTTKFENAYIMGLCVLFILLFSSLITSLFRKIIPPSIQMPTFIVIIATFVTILEMFLSTYLKDLYYILNVYIALIVVNCIVLGRCISFYSKNDVLTSLKDAVGIGLGFMVSLMFIAFFREILGSNTLTIMDATSSITGYKAVYKILPNMKIFPLSLFATPAGAFITIGILMGLFNRFIKGGKHGSN